MLELFNTILYRPLFNAVIFLYDIIPGGDFGLAIVALTVIIRLAFSPLSIKTIQSQKTMNKINPKLKAIKEKFKNDNQAQSAAIMELYKEHKVNPFFGCLPLLIQLPILIALYRAFRAGFQEANLSMLYSFVKNPGHIHTISLGFIDITSRSIALAIITGVFQFIQLKQNSSITGSAGGVSDQKELQALNSQMLYFFPVMIIIIGWNLPAGLLFYWVAATLFSMGEQLYVKTRYKD